MQASGTVFLTHTASTAIDSRGKRCVVLPCIHKDGLHSTRWLLHWYGTDAEQFSRSHAGQLRPGAALNVKVAGIRSINNVTQANVLACETAPARWPSRASTTATQSTPTAN